jgi:DNA polymerase-4
VTRPYILHLDVDAFFSSTEEILDPSLKGKRIIVGARPEQRGMVASASYAVSLSTSQPYTERFWWRSH